MMSGMYAAISGLDAHQTMLDVTANNLANVDTVGYKAQSAAVRRRALAADRRRHRPPTATAPAPTRSRSASASQVGSIDNVMTAGGVAVDRQRHRRARSRATASCGSPTATPTRRPRRSFDAAAVHPRRRPDVQLAGLPVHPDRSVRARLRGAERHTARSTPPAAPTTPSYVPTGSTGHHHRHGRQRHLRRRRPGLGHLPAARDRRLHLAGHVPQPGRPAARRRLAVERHRRVRRRNRRASRASAATARRSAASSSSRTSTWAPSSPT